jgi:hypothetical protein
MINPQAVTHFRVSQEGFTSTPHAAKNPVRTGDVVRPHN